MLIFTSTCDTLSNYVLHFLLCHIFSQKKVAMAYGKGKAIPLQAWTGPEGPRRLRLPDFKTFGT